MLCVCGLSFMQVDWLRNRKRGYCSVKCRKNEVIRKLNLRKKRGKLENLADNVHGRAGVQAPSEQGNAA